MNKPQGQDEGQTIKLFLVDGKADGMITAEIHNWTGHLVLAPRLQMSQLSKRDEASRTGIYFLVEQDSDRPCVYIGESDNVGERLPKHFDKDFWGRACIVTSKDDNLTKAHARYLESRLCEIIKSTGRAALTNETSPKLPSLPESDCSDMEYFINQIRLILPVLRMNFLSSPSQSDEGSFELKSSKHNIKAWAIERDDGKFIVKKDSTAQPKWMGRGTGGENTSAARQRAKLFENGEIIPRPDGLLADFVKDVLFRRPSAAAEAVLGRSANGLTEWKVEGTGKTYDEWENERLKAGKQDSE